MLERKLLTGDSHIKVNETFLESAWLHKPVSLLLHTNTKPPNLQDKGGLFLSFYSPSSTRRDDSQRALTPPFLP